jgi:hypothetical protein
MRYHTAIRSVVLTLVGLTFAASGVTQVRADRPSAPHLLPERTVAYVRVSDTQELIEKFRETALGRITQDPQIQPLIGQLYGSAAEAFSRIEEQVGLPLNKLLAIPQGEICLALVSPEQGQPALVVLLEVQDQLPSARKLLDRMEEEMTRNGAVKTTENIGDVQLTILDQPNRRNNRVMHFEKDGVIAFVTNKDLAVEVLGVWTGESKDVKTLADNTKFTAIMKRSAGTKDERPQLSWFVDPIELFRTAVRGNAGAQLALAFLNPLGLDGLQGIGGSVIMGTEEFDTIAHIHVLLDNPRRGVIELFALGAGDSTPEVWVPNDVASYTTLHWDVETTYTTFAKLYNEFRGEGALEADVKQRISDPLGVEFEKDLLQAIDGRITYVTWMEKPARLNSQTNMLAIKLKDTKTFQNTFNALVGRYENVFTKTLFGGVTYYQAPSPQNPNAQENPLLRRPEPCLAILGDYLLLTDSSQFLHQAILTKSDASRSLANELDYKLIASKISRQVGGNKPGMVSFNRPEVGMRALYDLATAETTRDRLSSQAESNGFFRAINDALRDNPLPPFSVLQQYLAPGGGMLTNDETGFHYTSFTLRRKLD